MGTDLSATDSPKPASVASRPLWQVPVFIAGVAALACAWVAHAPVDSGPRQVARQLAKARQLLSRPDGDAESAAVAAQHALDEMGADGDRIGEASFLLGTARMRQADRALGEEGKTLWLTARRFFEDAERAGVPAQDKPHLRYRLAKVSFHTGEDPRRVAERLAEAAPDAEDGAEAYDLLSQAYLSQNPPDYSKALEANTKLREQSILQIDMLAKVQLRSGELKLKMGHIEEARKDLELINPSAPASIICRARLLRARSYQEESKWGEAATLWQEAINDKREAITDRAEVFYLLGVCHRHLDQIDDAVKAWEECIHAGDATPEGVAAAIQLAELRLTRKEYAHAVDLLATTVNHIHKAAEWKNPYIDRAKALEIFEKSAGTLRASDQFELALQLTGHYDRLAAPGKAASLRAEIATDWARKRKTASAGTTPPPEEDPAIRDLFCKAGEAFIEASTNVADGGAEHLWQAASRFLDGHDLTRAVSTLDRYLKDEKRPERLGEGWFLLGEAQRQSKNTDVAEQAYVSCLKYPTPFAFRARYQLALLYWEAGRADQARDILVQNLQQLRFDPDAEALEKSLYALGNFAYQRHDYAEVVKRLEEALNQFPANADHTRALRQLAESYRQLAVEAKRDELIGDSPNPEFIKHLRQKHQQFLQKAAVEYQELATFLEKPESTGHLTPAERAEVPLIAADLRYNLGQYKEALALYEKLMDSDSGTKRVLALAGAARCHFTLGQREKLQERLDEIRKALAGLDEPTRQQWEEWLSLASGKPAVQ
jgi:tetratricopeptide (TPR) repeat protein